MSTMRPDQLPETAMLAQRGFALLSAIFLLVVLATLGAVMVMFSTVQHATSAQDVNGTKTYQAARAGIEWGVFQVLRNDVCGTTTTLPALGGALAGIAVTVQCAVTTETEGMVAGNVRFFRITSTATTGGAAGNPNYVERQLQALVEK